MGACCATENPTLAETVPEKAEKVAEKVADVAPGETKTESPPSAVAPFAVKVEKVEGLNSKVGLDVVHDSGMYLKVKKVKEGLVEEWNKSHGDSAVQVDDHIVKVNDVSGSSDAMLAEIKTAKVLEFSVSRDTPSRFAQN
jgi:hypothetical protein